MRGLYSCLGTSVFVLMVLFIIALAVFAAAIR